MNNHPFHLVNNSPWPICTSLGMMTFMLGMIMWINKNNFLLISLGIMIILISSFQWWRDVIRESTFQGLHTNKVVKNMKWGMILFIVSEIMFFSSFFWSFFHSSLSPSIEIGLIWPPLGIKTFNPMSIPMLNTLILLYSGISMTWAHHAILCNNFSQSMKSMIITVFLGMYFSLLQMYEYIKAPFCISDSIYGSTFFMSTGFHGIHVIIGSIFIMLMTMRLYNLHFSNKHHVGFECSAWYWHFVDLVWLFLYVSIYWWGS
uniref:cytochrome c oxidase subunit III n=1 Tax=Stroggylocephalus agrestis TaxID=3112133 RepID=UPI002E774514|nr:cytochrome c oxidase subunit III [Stroggylocephalus agrestis]WRK21276.1 cytochrome c oxidase subunit III [Stroggylocephalus agrestis]